MKKKIFWGVGICLALLFLGFMLTTPPKQSYEALSLEIENSIKALDALGLRKSLSQTESLYPEQTSEIYKKIGTIIETQINQMTVEKRGTEAKNFIIAVDQSIPDLIADLYYDYVTSSPDVPEVIFNHQTGEYWMTLYGYGYMYYSLDGETYTLYPEHAVAIGENEVVWTYAQNAFDTVSEKKSYSINRSDSAIDTFMSLLKKKQPNFTMTQVYLDGIYKTRLFQEASLIENTTLEGKAVSKEQLTAFDLDDAVAVEYIYPKESGNELVRLILPDAQVETLKMANQIFEYMKDKSVKVAFDNYSIPSSVVYDQVDLKNLMEMLKPYIIEEDLTWIEQISKNTKDSQGKLTQVVINQDKYLVIEFKNEEKMAFNAELQRISEDSLLQQVITVYNSVIMEKSKKSIIFQ